MLDAPRMLLALSVLMILLIVAAAALYETAWSNPEPHPRIATMEIGGARAVEDAQHWGLGVGFGVATILSLVTSLLFAAQHSKYAARLKLAVMAGGVVYVAVFVAMMVSYREYVQEGPSILGPFATPTTWMVLGLWAVPVIFVVMYCAKFNTWFAPETEAQTEGEAN